MKKKELKSNVEELIKKYSAINGDVYEEFHGALSVLSTGSIDVDMALGPLDPILGNGGIRSRDTMEILGKPGNGKNVLLHSIIRTTQERWPDEKNIVCVFTEPPDIPRMRREGVKVENLIILGCYHKDSVARQLEASYLFEAVLEFSHDPNIRLITLDSVSMFTTTAQEEKDLDEAQPVASMGVKFNIFISRFVKQTAFAPLVYTNHYREKINTGFSFIPPSQLIIESAGGRTKEFLAAARILASAEPKWREENGTKVVHSVTGKRIQEGLNITYTLFRNRYSNKDNYRACKVSFNFDDCKFNNEERLIKIADYFTVVDENSKEVKSLLSPGIIQKGSRYLINGENLHGMPNAVKYLRDNPDLSKQIELQVMKRSGDFYSNEKDFSVEEVLDS